MDKTFFLHPGSLPLLVSIPHLGTLLPEEMHGLVTGEAKLVADTDWHLDRLYGFVGAMGASILGAKLSRYAIDLNRAPGGESLYPGMTTTTLCPLETFRGVPLYKSGHEPDDAEIFRRRQCYWRPYHDALEAELQRLLSLHGQVLLWEAHSIAGVLPRLFEGQLPDLNFGTNSGASCSGAVIDAVLAPAREAASTFSHVLNGRFKGGYITRHYGQPDRGIHAIQLEMRQALYMDESPPFGYRADQATRVASLLERMVMAGVQAIRELR